MELKAKLFFSPNSAVVEEEMNEWLSANPNVEINHKTLSHRINNYGISIFFLYSIK